MSDHNFRKTGLDDAIDNVVRDVVRLDPRPGLRRRVLSQLGASQPSSSWIPRLLVPLGALACILAAVLVLSSRQRAEPAVARSTAVAPITVPAVPPAVASAAAAPAAATALPTAERVTPSRSSRPRRVSTPRAVFEGPTGRVSAASVPARPGVVEPAAGSEPAYALRPLAPLVLPGLVIPPLGLPALAPVKKEIE